LRFDMLGEDLVDHVHLLSQSLVFGFKALSWALVSFQLFCL